jgi:hypothetical protein
VFGAESLKTETHKTIILLTFYVDVRFGVTLTDEQGLGLSQNRVLRKIFGAKRDEVTGEWRRLQKEELNDL